MQNSVTILYFASLSEALAIREEVFNLPPEVNSLGNLRRHLLTRGAQWQALSATNIRMAVNQVLADENQPLRQGDEIAFFPPVTGG